MIAAIEPTNENNVLGGEIAVKTNNMVWNMSTMAIDNIVINMPFIAPSSNFRDNGLAIVFPWVAFLRFDAISSSSRYSVYNSLSAFRGKN